MRTRPNLVVYPLRGDTLAAIPGVAPALRRIYSRRQFKLAIEDGPKRFPGLGYECEWDGRLIGAAGISVFEPWLGVAWLAAAPGVSRRVWPFVTFHAEAMLARAHDYGIRRIECFVQHRQATNAAWAIKLGFAFESTCYGRGTDGETLDRYVRLDMSADWKNPRVRPKQEKLHRSRGAGEKEEGEARVARQVPRGGTPCRHEAAWPFREHRSLAEMALLPGAPDEGAAGILSSPRLPASCDLSLPEGERL